MKTLLVFAVCICAALSNTIVQKEVVLVAGEQSEPTQKVFEDEILAILESIRDIIINGNDDLPVLDPFQYESISLNLAELGLANGEINVSNMTLLGASTFNVNSLSLSLLTQRLTFDISIPALEFQVEDYNFNINALGNNLFGTGPGRFVVRGAGLSGTVQVRIGIISGISVASADVVLRIQGVESAIEGLLGGAAGGNFLNNIIQELIPELVTQYQSQISSILNTLIVELANDLLQTGNSTIFKQLFILFPGVLDAILPL